MSRKLLSVVVAAAFGVVLALTALLALPWYEASGIRVPAVDSGVAAWGGAIVSIVAGAVVILAGLDIADSPATRLAGVACGIVGTSLVTARWISSPDFASLGLFVALVAGLCVTLAALLLAWTRAGDPGAL